jgi:hypothetical protein
LWLARIAALRGDLPKALAYYQPLLDDSVDDAAFAEVTIVMVEAHILSKDWATAEHMLHGFLLQQPDHPRAKEMLAWVLDARGHLDGPGDTRGVRQDWTDHAQDSGPRAPARLSISPGARRYHSRWLGVDEVDDDVNRLERRLAPRSAAGSTMRDDPSVIRAVLGASLPLGGRYASP